MQHGGEPSINQKVPERYFVVTNDEMLRVKYILVFAQERVRPRYRRERGREGGGENEGGRERGGEGEREGERENEGGRGSENEGGRGKVVVCSWLFWRKMKFWRIAKFLVIGGL